MNSLTKLPGIGPKTLLKLTRLKINSPHQLLYHFPSKYLDFSNITNIADIQEGTAVTISGTLKNFQNIYTRSHKNIQIATVEDSTGFLKLIWFNQPYLSKSYQIGQKYSFAGTVSLYQNKKTIIGSISGTNNTGKIISIYPETSGLSSNWFRKFFSQNIDQLVNLEADPIPSKIVKKYQLLGLTQALRQIHSPDNNQILEQARLRLSIDEMLVLKTNSYLKKQDWQSKSPHQKFLPKPQIEAFIKELPFKLTSGQSKAWQEIYQDLVSDTPANRLLQGDVGSGKTILAILSAYLASLNQATSLIVVPTEILAKQHFETFSKFLDAPVHLLTGNHRLGSIQKNSIIIATHAAIYRKESFLNQVGLLVIDEQHKFGVDQRNFLHATLHPPHCLTMTATPIPRSISLTILGNLELSLIDTLPKNRLPIKTFLVPPTKTESCYQWLEQHLLKTQQQAFIVCPFIDTSETLTTVKSATQHFKYLQEQVFRRLKLALIHGKTKEIDKQKILTDFLKNKINVLVTTPIIEVGIDFPNATTIIIESADRFGLAQLHQLRGRVGRGVDQSYCYLLSDSDQPKAVNRLKVLANTQNGQKISQYDLETRGPGEAFSYLQHGFPSLKLADLSDLKLTKISQQILLDLTKLKPKYDLTRLVDSNIFLQHNLT